MTITLPPKKWPAVTRHGQAKITRLRTIWRQAREAWRVSRFERRAKLRAVMRECARERRAMMLPRKWGTI